MNLTKIGLLNKDLFNKFKDIHLYDKPKSITTKDEIALEILKCKYNILYFINNYVLIPVKGGGSTNMLMNKKTTTVALLYQASVPHIFQTSRQSSKTTLEIVCASWYVNFWENANILFYNRVIPDNKKNLRDIKKILSLLPKFMQSYNPLIHPNNVNTLRNGIDSSIELFVIPKDSPDSAGRGNTGGLYLDECGFLKNIHLAFTPLSFVYSNYSRIARSNYAPAPFAITSTPADPATPEGEFFMNLWDNAYEITLEEIQSLSPHEIYDYVNSITDNLMVRVYQKWYEFPGRCDPNLFDEDNENNILELLDDPFVDLKDLSKYDMNAVTYLKEVRSKCSTKTQLRREVYCEFLSAADESIFDEDFLESIPRHEPKKTIKLPESNNGVLKIYKDLSETEILDNDYALCIDPAYRVKGGDFAAIILFNMNTMEIDGATKIKVGKIKRVSKVIEYLFDIFKNALIVIEKNNFGQAIIEDLLEIPRIKPRIFYSYGNKKEKNLTSITREDSRVYGVQTDSGSRPKMIQAMKSWVENNPDKIKSPELISELSSLQQRKNGRVEAAPGRHDDMVLAVSFILYLIEYKHKDLMRFRRFTNTETSNMNRIQRLNVQDTDNNPMYQSILNQQALNLPKFITDHMTSTSNDRNAEIMLNSLEKFKNQDDSEVNHTLMSMVNKLNK